MRWARTIKERLLATYMDDSNGCWLWTGPTMSQFGYGRIKVKAGEGYSAHEYAHRTSYALFRGEIPDGLCVCHRCDVPACINPEHLFLGTYKDNTQDAIAKGRFTQHLTFGGKPKFDAAKAVEMRREGRLYREIAATLGCSVTGVTSLLHRGGFLA